MKIKEQKLLQKIIQFLNEAQSDTRWWAHQLLRPDRFHKSIKKVIRELLIKEQSFCLDIVKEKREDARTISNYKNRLRRATKLVNELSWY